MGKSIVSKATDILCRRPMESCWLLILVFCAVFFNTCSQRIFEADRLAFMRSFALMILAFWGAQVMLSADARNKLSARVAATELLKQPAVFLCIAILAWSGVSTLLSVWPAQSLWGSYLRDQGWNTQAFYAVLFLSVVFHCEELAQIDALVSALIIVSLPVALYSIVQHYSLLTYYMDPICIRLNSYGARSQSTLGNPLFVAGLHVTVVFLVLSRLITATRSILQTTNRRVRLLVYFLAIMQVIALWGAWNRGIGPGIIGTFGSVCLWLVTALFFRKPISSFLVVAANAIVLALQLASLDCANCRGSALALVGGLFFFWIIVASWTRSRVGLIAAISVLALAVLFLWQINDSDSVVAKLKTWHPVLFRLAELKDSSSQYRLETWGIAGTLLNRLDYRAVVGYGPDCITEAIGPYQTAITSAGNQLNDRMHNDTLETFVGTGIVGNVLFYCWITALLYAGLATLGLVRTKSEKWLLGSLLLAWTCAAMVIIHGFQPHATVLGYTAGHLSGLGCYLCIRTLFMGATCQPAGEFQVERAILITCLVSAVLAQWFDLAFRFPSSTTHTAFVLVAALIIVARKKMSGAPANECAGNSPKTANSTACENRHILPLLATAAVTLAVFVFCLNVQPCARSAEYEWSLLCIIGLCFFLLAPLMTAIAHQGDEPVLRIKRLLLSWILLAIFFAASLVILASGTPHSRDNTIDPETRIGVLIVLALLFVLGLSAQQLWRERARAVFQVKVLAVPLLTAVAAVLAWKLFLTPIRADMYYQNARLLPETSTDGDKVIEHTVQACSLAPEEASYRLHWAKLILMKAEGLQRGNAEREKLLAFANKNIKTVIRTSSLSVQVIVQAAAMLQACSILLLDANAGKDAAEESLRLARLAVKRWANADYPAKLLFQGLDLSAQSAEKCGDAKHAIELLQEMIALRGETADLHFRLGGQHAACNESAKAEQSYLKAIALKPDDWRVANNLAALYAEMDESTKAVHWAKTALPYAPAERKAELEKFLRLSAMQTPEVKP